MGLSTETEKLIGEISGEEQEPAAAETEAAQGGAVAATEAPEERRVQRGCLPKEEPPVRPVSEETEEQHADGIDQRDRDFLAALGVMLERQNRSAAPPPRTEEPAIERFTHEMTNKGVGVVSLALNLVMMGVVLICCLFSSAPDFLLPVKFAPAAAVIVGLELLAHYFTSGKRIRVHIPCICISAVMIVGCCIMAVSLNETYSVQKTEYNNRSVAAQIYDSSYKELRYVADIASLDVEVDLNPDGTGREKGLEALSTDDFVKITIVMDGSFTTPREFAEECKSVIDGYRILGIPVTEFHFSNENRLNTFRLDVAGKFAQDYSEARLAEEVNHVYVEDYDYIDDLEDFVAAETEETEQAE